MNNESTTITYKSLADIRLRKEILRNDILKDDHKIQGLWKSLFHKPAIANSNAKPSERIQSLMNNSVGIVDGLLLAWKLYRKFKR